MSDKKLRNNLIRLAHSKPELRKHLLPLLKKAKDVKDYDKAFLTRIENSKVGRAYELRFANATEGEIDGDATIGYEFVTNITTYTGRKESIYVDVIKWDDGAEMYSVTAKVGKGIWDYYSEKDLLKNLPNILKQLS